MERKHFFISFFFFFFWTKIELALFNSNRNYRFLRNNGLVCRENGNETIVELHCSSTVAIVWFRIVASLQRRLMRFLLFYYFFFSLADPLLTCNLSILEKVMGSNGSASQKKKKLKIIEVFIADWLQYRTAL
jgi:hypothetical protein